MNKIILIIAACSIICFESYAQTKQELIRQLFLVMKQDSLTDKMFNSILPSMMLQMNKQLSPEAKARLDEHLKSNMHFMGIMMKKFLDEELVGIYDKRFTQAEINDYIAFYKTSSGQKMINSMGEIQKDVMTIMTQKYMPMIMEQMKH